mmetsp:Transcript_93140/g.267998  ORF Transcript_93140/g.267998 Transcript_93140/m.267998 type:complete len:99 (-) Transcript_93140:1852-2148(-)
MRCPTRWLCPQPLRILIKIIRVMIVLEVAVAVGSVGVAGVPVSTVGAAMNVMSLRALLIAASAACVFEGGAYAARGFTASHVSTYVARMIALEMDVAI